jgi:hypothetical protein
MPTSGPPKWIKPQLTRLVDEAPTGNSWLHEIKYDGYRMHALIDDGRVQLLTRSGLDWSHRHRATIGALRPAGEVCLSGRRAVRGSGREKRAAYQRGDILDKRRSCSSPTSLSGHAATFATIQAT